MVTTTGHRDALGLFLDRLRGRQLLTADEERALGARVQAGRAAAGRAVGGAVEEGDPELLADAERAVETFVGRNLRLVFSIARQYTLPPGMDRLDLVQDGFFGLRRAAERWDPDRGFRFSTYATDWIHQSIGRAIDSRGSFIRLPIDRANQLRRSFRRAEELDDGMAELALLSRPTSLDATIADGERPLADLVAGNELSGAGFDEAVADHRVLLDLLGTLPNRERHALVLRFGLTDGVDRTYSDIAAALRTRPASASRLVQDALESLQRRVDSWGSLTEQGVSREDSDTAYGGDRRGSSVADDQDVRTPTTGRS